MQIPTLPGVTSRIVKTDRLLVHLLTTGSRDGIPVLFVHGNVSSATFWEETMLALPVQYYAIAVDLRGYGATEPLPVDATQGLGDMVEDLRSLVETIGLERYHIAGHSMGGGIVMKYAIEYPEDLLSITLVDTMSPYGYGGSYGPDGEMTYDDGAPAGINPEFVALLAAGERGDENPMAPRNVLRQFYVKPPFVPGREEELVSSMLSIRIGDDFYPGEMVPSANWPGVAPGERGILPAFSRKYFDASDLIDISPKPPVLWIRGADDMIVGDMAMFDLAALGAIGAVPGYPGAEEVPPQPMLQQIRAVLDAYAAAGGDYEEVVIEDAGHSPYLEKPEEFNGAFHAFLAAHPA
jgi:pimeloyl-ACP methyl ester carboxylesterase